MQCDFIRTVAMDRMIYWSLRTGVLETLQPHSDVSAVGIHWIDLGARFIIQRGGKQVALAGLIEATPMTIKADQVLVACNDLLIRFLLVPYIPL